jgi:predicted outer membrane protein
LKEPSKKETEYLQKSMQGAVFEVKMGEMAQEHAADERVKQFGKRMVDDHGKELQNIRQLASHKHGTLPGAPNKEQSDEADKLAKLSGTDLDIQDRRGAQKSKSTMSMRSSACQILDAIEAGFSKIGLPDK